MNLLDRNKPVPRASDVRIEGNEVTIVLSGAAIEGSKLTFPARELKPFQNATDEQLADVSILQDGALLYWRALDAEFRVSTLLGIVTGVKDPATTGAMGGKASTEAKTAAVRANGAKGGRPRKTPIEA